MFISDFFFVTFSLGKYTYPAFLFSFVLLVLAYEDFGWLVCIMERSWPNEMLWRVFFEVTEIASVRVLNYWIILLLKMY